MAFPSRAFRGHDGRVYSEWEIHKLAASGLARLSLFASVAALALVVADVALFRGGHPGALPSWAPKVAGGLALLVACGFLALAQVRKSEVQRPQLLGLLLCLGLAVGGAVVSAAAGGLGSALGMGLVPVAWAWALTMPRGASAAAVPIAGSFVIHVVLTTMLSGEAPQGVDGPALVMALATGLALAAAQVVETWREKAAAQSTQDWLTGALARPALEARLETLCAMRARSLAPVSLVMFDVDHFKSINDGYGRGAGDEVLEMLVNSINSEIRASDFIGRCGGDEFLLVLDECEGPQAVALLERLRHRLAARPMVVSDSQVRVSFSAGVVSVGPGDSLVVKELLRNAEKALSASKDTARNRTSMAPPPPPGSGSVVEVSTSAEVSAVETQGFSPTGNTQG